MYNVHQAKKRDYMSTAYYEPEKYRDLRNALAEKHYDRVEHYMSENLRASGLHRAHRDFIANTDVIALSHKRPKHSNYIVRSDSPAGRESLAGSDDYVAAAGAAFLHRQLSGSLPLSSPPSSTSKFRIEKSYQYQYLYTRKATMGMNHTAAPAPPALPIADVILDYRDEYERGRTTPHRTLNNPYLSYSYKSASYNHNELLIGGYWHNSTKLESTRERVQKAEEANKMVHENPPFTMHYPGNNMRDRIFFHSQKAYGRRPRYRDREIGPDVRFIYAATEHERIGYAREENGSNGFLLESAKPVSLTRKDQKDRWVSGEFRKYHNEDQHPTQGLSRDNMFLTQGDPYRERIDPLVLSKIRPDASYRNQSGQARTSRNRTVRRPVVQRPSSGFRRSDSTTAANIEAALEEEKVYIALTKSYSKSLKDYLARRPVDLHQQEHKITATTTISKPVYAAPTAVAPTASEPFYVEITNKKIFGIHATSNLYEPMQGRYLDSAGSNARTARSHANKTRLSYDWRYSYFLYI